MIEEYDHVLVKETGTPGTVISKTESKGKTVYVVESDTETDGYFKRFLCLESELEVI